METGPLQSVWLRQKSVETLGKTTADLKLLDQTYPSSNFRVLKNLCADVIVGQTFLKLHSSVTYVMNEQKKALTIAASSDSWSHSSRCCRCRASASVAILEFKKWEDKEKIGGPT